MAQLKDLIVFGAARFLGNTYSSTFTGDLIGKIATTKTNPSSKTTYYVPFISGVSGNQEIKANDGIKYYNQEGTTSAVGTSDMILGNPVASGTAGNKKGGITLYGANTGHTYLTTANTSTSNYTITLPAKTGTVALTSDYSSKSAVSGGTDVSLVTTGEKFTWNNKLNKSDITVSNVDIGEGASLASGKFYFVYE